MMHATLQFLNCIFLICLITFISLVNYELYLFFLLHIIIYIYILQHVTFNLLVVFPLKVRKTEKNTMNVAFMMMCALFVVIAVLGGAIRCVFNRKMKRRREDYIDVSSSYSTNTNPRRRQADNIDSLPRNMQGAGITSSHYKDLTESCDQNTFSIEMDGSMPDMRQPQQLTTFGTENTIA